MGLGRKDAELKNLNLFISFRHIASAKDSFLSFFLSRMALHRKREASRNREQDGWNAWRGSYLKFVWYPRLDRRKKEKKEKDRGKSIRRFHSHHRVSQRGGRYSRVKNREISFFLS